MKKLFIIIALFVIPICAYLFFASGVNRFIKLPTLTQEVSEIPAHWKRAANDSVKLQNKITIIGFTGTDIGEIKGGITNLAHKIYSKNRGFVDFQVVYIAPEQMKEAIEKEVVLPLERDVDFSSWHFVYAPQEEIKPFFDSFQLEQKLQADSGSRFVFIIDKKRNLRGRKGKNKKGDDEYREGYDTQSAADLHNEMSDDVKVILAEYRLARKENNTKENVTE